MRIEYSHKFQVRLGIIVDFIALDSPTRARKFYSELKSFIKKATFMPYKHRKNITVDDERVRDLIFSGYVVPFFIDKERDRIEILSIYGRNLP